jgi:hypothetical protein
MSGCRCSPRLPMLALVFSSLFGTVALKAAVFHPTSDLPPSPDISLLGFNLVINPNFNTGLSGWSNFDPSSVSWSSNDQAGNANSGSAYIVSPTSSGAAVLYQCINLPANWRSQNLSLTYWTYTATGAPPANGNGLLVLYYYSAPDCASNTLFSSNEFFSNYTGGVWQKGGAPIQPPDLAQSVIMFLGSTNTAPGVATGVNFDSVFFGYIPATGVCGEDPTLLCVDNNRFQVTAKFSQECLTGSTSADGVQISSVGGFLWCFDPSNPEIFVKVLDACTPQTGNTYWVFVSGLTNVGVTVTVTDTVSGLQKSYTNPVGSPFASIEDTVGLKVCP